MDHVIGTFRTAARKPAVIDMVLLTVATLIVYSICADYDLLERYVEWAHKYEEYELDEILLLGMFSTISLAIFALRRMVDLRKQVRLRQTSDDKAHYLAYHDALTGLVNRTRFNDELEDALVRVCQGPVAVLTIDLDRFKDVNDTMGHAAGDVLLRTVAQRLRRNCRPTDIIGRFGGDEFVILQKSFETTEGVTRLAERLVAALSLPYDFDGQEIVSSASIGFAIAPQDAADSEGLLLCADAALYEAKRAGRAMFQAFVPGMKETLLERHALELDLRRALEDEALSVHYQPIHDLQSKALIGYEALLRWQHPEKGNIPPSEFIPLAEETGLIVDIGNWVLCKACEDAKHWAEPAIVSVNLSALQFLKSDIVATVKQALVASGLPPARLELEITESLLLTDTDGVLMTLGELRALGISIAMDDFGTGFSSLGYLWRFPFDKLKIDKSFVKDLHENDKVGEIIRTIISLGHTLNLSVTAEGIETPEQLDDLALLGCNIGQGFYLGRPMPGHLIAAQPTKAGALPPIGENEPA